MSSILVSTDQKHLVFLGARYHYIFDAPAALARMLSVPARHQSNGVQPPASAQALNRSYTVRVSEPESVLFRVVRPLLTPITVAIDGALLIAAIPLVPAWPIVLLHLYRGG